jgi:prepilin-type processing-associated H-X9-DG protein
MKQLAVALHNYHDTFLAFPCGTRSSGNQLSWSVAILPYIEQKPLYDKFDQKLSGYDKFYVLGVNRIDTFLCPSGKVERSLNTPEAATNPVTGANEVNYTIHYYGVMGPKGPIPDFSATPNPTPPNYRLAGIAGYGDFALQGILTRDTWKKMRDVTDGTSNTFLLGEISWNDANCYRSWLRGGAGTPSPSAKNVYNAINLPTGKYNNADNFNDVSFGSQHPGGCQFAMADGSVMFVQQSINMDVYKATASCDGGETKTVNNP